MSVLYTTDSDGIIQSVGPGAWDEFASQNGAPELLDHSRLIGRSLLDFISGQAARTATLSMLHQLRTGARETLSYLFSCDSPDTTRTMRLTIHRMADGKTLEFQSKTLSERPRLVHLLTGSPGNHNRLDWPIRTICSVCKRVKSPQQPSTWLDIEQYEREGGETAVRISHGLCETCLSSLMAGVS